MKEERNIITMDGQGNISLPSDIGATAMTEWEICEPFGGLQPRNDSRPRFPCRIVRGGESPQGIIREDYTRAKRENDGIRVGCFGRQAQQLLESMMIYQHANLSLW